MNPPIDEQDARREVVGHALTRGWAEVYYCILSVQRRRRRNVRWNTEHLKQPEVRKRRRAWEAKYREVRRNRLKGVRCVD